MKRKSSRHQQLSSWLKNSPLGHALLEAEKAALDIIWNYVSGDYLVMLGSPVQSCLIEKSQFLNKVMVTPDKLMHSKEYQMVCAEYETFPILSNSVDAVLLPHTLEFSADSYQVLRSVASALKADGFLMVIGFNPWSLWGLRGLFSLGKKAPWSGSFRRAFRIKEGLKLLSFELVEQKHAAYHIPFCHSKKKCRYPMIEKFCQRCLPIFGGVYIIVAQKKTYTVTPLQSQWTKVKSNMHRGIAEPVRRNFPHEENR